ncbi:hypothetical protein [Nioella sp.]|uniref:hypothetical protein n=1 Tax=Nioella sp. TaxID=1912091 RepID=UPI003518D1EA
MHASKALPTFRYHDDDDPITENDVMALMTRPVSDSDHVSGGTGDDPFDMAWDF